MSGLRESEPSVIPVIDLFAGPGGLNEGFSSVMGADGAPVFHTAASFEMESSAIETLTLRAALRSLRDGDGFPSVYYDFLNGRMTEAQLRADEAIEAALKTARTQEVFQVELGEGTRGESDDLIQARVGQEKIGNQPWVLIGGPPCQAYSLAGRARRTSDDDFYDDKKHFLFREYLHIIERFRPTIFVMENVKGLLSSKLSKDGGESMFDMIREDISLQGAYEIRSLVIPGDSPRPQDYVIRSEKFGVPQRRHRVILLGVQRGFEKSIDVLTPSQEEATAKDVLSDIPGIRSVISPRRVDSPDEWANVRNQGRVLAGLGRLHTAPPPPGSERVEYAPDMATAPLRDWLLDAHLEHLTLHTSRAHMAADLIRYEYLAHVLNRDGVRPTVLDLPKALRPAHKNVGPAAKSTPFLDRFKVQGWDAPSSTVTSHIAKDGHYYIHPDPDQMRSLSVREAARLQTFPDNYWFVGSRTQRYHQVGNAVPPYLAWQIGTKVAKALGAL